MFPDAFYVAERGRTHLDQPRDRKQREEKGRLLSAGYHNMFGFFRDDLPLVERILDARGRRELDQLWRELDFITLAPDAPARRLHLLRAGGVEDHQGAGLRLRPLRGQERHLARR